MLIVSLRRNNPGAFISLNEVDNGEAGAYNRSGYMAMTELRTC